MRRRTLCFLAAVLTAVLLMGLIFNSTAAAHAVRYRVAEDTKAVVVEFFYSSGEPLSYASILVWSPGADNVEFQNGRTDQNGRFAFAPSKSGNWRIEANDGRGHKKTAAIQIDLSPYGIATEAFKESGSEPTTVGVIFGVSLILNLIMTLVLLRRQRPSIQKFGSSPEELEGS